MKPTFVTEPALSDLIEPLLEWLDHNSSKYVENVGLFKSLREKLSAVYCFLVDAEYNQFDDVFYWLCKLHDAVYDLDDLVDEITIDDAQHEPVAKSQRQTTWMQIRNLIPTLMPSTSTSTGNPMKLKINSIITELKDLKHQAAKLGLERSSTKRNEGAADEEFVTFPSSTEASVDGLVVGRDEDKEQIVNFLLSDDVNRGDEISVISINGMTGLGKTTLAQLVFNDVRVKCHFDQRAWVYAGYNLDSFAVMKSILVAVTGHMSKSHDLSQVQNMLKDCSLGKRFLLVLDDVGVDSLGTWSTLRELLTAVARGCKILVTTRWHSVSSMMATPTSYDLKNLDDGHIWALFARCAQIADSRFDLPNIRNEITKKCRGLPLAAIRLGYLLRFKSVPECRYILNDISWGMDDTFRLQSLELCYYNLPANLKRCVAYCSLFPRFHEFEKEKLVRLWMAEGFLSRGKIKTEEDAVENYFHDLLQMSFFRRSSTQSSCFVMDDLIKDLASKLPLVRLGHSSSVLTVSERVRYLSYSKHDVSVEFMRLISKAKSLRTFLHINFLSDNEHGHLTDEELQNLFANFPRLRVLSLPFDDITQVPNSIGKLKHLRYLDLSYTTLKSLPRSITSLYNLQSLDLSYCQLLNKLPEDLWKLVNLLHLLISESGVLEMPLGMSRLTNLQTLTNFILSQGGSKIMELPRLSNLRGALSISKLEILRSEKGAFGFNLEEMKGIDELELKWTGESDDPDGDEDVLEYLVPPETLNRLVIESYGGKKFPYWLGFPSFSKMVFLRLSNCKNCLRLPPVGQLTFLQFLEVKGLHGITKIGPEVYGGQRPFRSLQILKFDEMLKWEEWEMHETEDGGFPSLQELYITNCPNLKGHMPKRCPSLNKLVISECLELVKFLGLPVTSSPCNISIDGKRVEPRCGDRYALPSNSDANEVCSLKQECSLQENVDRTEAFDSSPQSSMALDVAELKKMPHKTQMSSSPQEVASQSTLSMSKTTTMRNEVDDQAEALNVYPEHILDTQLEELRSTVIAPILWHKVPSQATQTSSPHHSALQSSELIEFYTEQREKNIRLARCPVCGEVLSGYPDDYRCGICGTLLKGRRYKDKDALAINSDENDKSSLKQEVSLHSAPLIVKTVSEIIEGDAAKASNSSPQRSEHLHDTLSEKLHTLVLSQEVASETTQASTSHDVALESSPQTSKSTRISDDEAESINSEDETGYHHYFSPGILKVSTVAQLEKLPTDLHSLVIEGCDNLKFLPFKILSTNPSILHLYIIDCDFSYISFAKGARTTSLKTLHIRNCMKLKFPSSSEMVRECAGLEHFSLGNSCESLDSFPLNLFPKLQVLCLWGCMNLSSFSIEKELACNAVEALESLEIRDCPNLRSFPEGGFSAPNLTSIIISNCNKLRSLPEQMHRLKSLQSMFISKCEELTSLPAEGLPESLNLLCIKSCDKITSRKEWKLKELVALTQFEIEGGCADIESFPEEGLLPKCLIELRISRLPIRYLDPVGLQQLTSLEKLEINCCKRLRHLPEELPSSLSFLSIKDCPLLKAKLQKRTGTDWYRIADILTIFVDDMKFH